MIKLEWDSRFFGMEVYEYRNVWNNTVSQELLDVKFDLAYISSPQIIRTTLKASYIGGKIFLKKELEASLKQRINNNIIMNPSVIPEEVYQLAILSGQFSRFNLDYNIKKEKFIELYKIWVTKSLQETDHKIFFYKKEEKIVGFVSLKFSHRDAVLGLIAVNADYNGQGIGSALIRSIETDCLDNDIETLTIATQMDNIAALNFYQQLDYKICNKIYINHIWSYENPI